MCSCGKSYVPQARPSTAQPRIINRATLFGKKPQTDAAGYVAARQSFDLKNKQGEASPSTQEN